MSNRFHNKFHRQNHHSKNTSGYPDSSYDPIASYAAPFQGEFYSQGDIVTTENLSAVKDIFATNGTLYNNLSVGYDALIQNNLTVQNDTLIQDNLTVGNNVQINNNLNINGNTTIQNNLTVTGNLTALGTFTQLDTIVSITSALSVVNSGTGPAATIVQTGAQDVAVFRDDSNTALIIKDGGNVGINTATPSEKFDVNGNAIVRGNATITNGLSVDTNLLTVDPISNQIGINTNTPNQTLTVIGNVSASGNTTIDGNVGIGTTTPNEKLTVVGNISAVGTHVFAVSSLSACVRITQTGDGEALRVEDSTNPDTTPFVVGSDGRVYLGGTQTLFNANLIVERPFQQTPQVASIYSKSPANNSNNLLANGIQSVVIADAGNYSIPNLNAFFAEGTDIRTSGVSATTVRGFWAHQSLSSVGFTNYGFYSDLVASNEPNIVNYNFYSNGGAPNYFAGNVGIGTDTPVQKLTVAGNLSASGTGTFGIVNSNTTSIEPLVLGANNVIEKRATNPAVWNTASIFVSASDNSLAVNRLTKATNGNGINESGVFEDGSGNVGIGTVIPNEKLTVVGNISATGFVYSNTSAYAQKYEALENFIGGSTGSGAANMIAVNNGGSLASSSNFYLDTNGTTLFSTGNAATINQSTGFGINVANKQICFGTPGSKRFLARLAHLELTDNTTLSGRFAVGFIDSFTASITSGAYFSLVNDGNLSAICVKNGIPTISAFNFRPTLSSMHIYDVQVASDASSVNFYYDKNLQATITTNIPTLSTERTNFGVSLLRAPAVATTLRMDVDQIYLRLDNPINVL